MSSITNPAPSQTFDAAELKQLSDPGVPKLFEQLKEERSANRAERRDLIAMQKQQNRRQKEVEEFEATVFSREQACGKAEAALMEKQAELHIQFEKIATAKAELEELRTAMVVAFDDRNTALQAREAAVAKREGALKKLEKKAFVST